MSVYVDDFKLAGRKDSLGKAWQLMLDKGLKLDPPEPFKEYLGCGQLSITLTHQEVQQRLEHIDPIRVDPDLPTAKTDASKRSAGIPVRSIAYDMRGFLRQVVEKYFQFFGKQETDLKSVQTPSIDDHQIPPEDFESKGSLSNDAARIVMKALYGARFVKYNLLWPICNLARRISCWSTADDRRLRRLVSYIHHTYDETLQSFVGDHANDLSVMLWVDASLADDLRDSKSTSGAYLAIVGPNTFAPIMSFVKKTDSCILL